MLPCICVMTTSLALSVTAARLSPLERMCANRSVLTFVPTLVLGQSGSKAHITAGFAPMPGVSWTCGTGAEQGPPASHRFLRENRTLFCD